MRIFNSVNKTKYFTALLLFLAFAFFVATINPGNISVKPLNPDIPFKSDLLFKYADVCTAFIYPAKTEFFGKYHGVRGLKQHHNVVRRDNVVQTPDFVLENHINNVYATSGIPYYTEVCKLLTQLIVIYIFMTDGKKRSYRLSYN